jgi:UDP-N-acetylglucosamine 1-carboxyvinyltransferase
MDKFVIKGRNRLKGEVAVSGAKNAAVAVLPAALLVEGCCTVENIPDISDVQLLIDIITHLGAKVKYKGKNDLIIDSTEINSYSASYNMVKSMRASYYLLGALLGRFKRAEVASPGGCNFGFRPIDQHIKGFEALGATVEIKHGLVKAYADKLVGAQIYLDIVSVGATINLMLAAVRAEGITTIENVAKEPHVVDVANFLNMMGANIKGAGTDVRLCNGNKKLFGRLQIFIAYNIHEYAFVQILLG